MLSLFFGLSTSNTLIYLYYHHKRQVNIKRCSCTATNNNKMRTLQLMGHSATDMESAGVCCASTWACGLCAPAATAAEAVQSRAHREQLLYTSAAVPLVKQAAGASSYSVAQTGMHSPGHCPSGCRQRPALYYAHGGTDTRGHYTQHESNSGASSAVSLWTSWRYLRRIHSAGLLCCWTQSSVHHQHVAPEVQLQYDSNTENITERLDFWWSIVLKFKGYC